MRILTTPAQIYRVANLEGGKGQYPDYPYGSLAIPQEVGRALLDNCYEIVWPADRDFLNDDGGFIVIFDSADEFDLKFPGMPPVTSFENIHGIDAAGERWWVCCLLTNNETSVDYVFREAITPPGVLEQLIEQCEASAMDEA